MSTRIRQCDKWLSGQGVVLGKSGIFPLAANVARDPVCRMAVAGKDALKLDYQGMSYRFCSAGGRENFRCPRAVHEAVAG